MPDNSSTYDVSQYIVDRLAALGVRELFTVPGNYCAEFLIRARKSGKLRCIGTTNEMEAGYAADAYARLKGLGVASVTYGVGTGSLLNAIEGAYVEFCPVVLLNGSPKAEQAELLVNKGVLFAHAIDPIRTDEAIFKPVTVATAVISDGEHAPAEVDRVLRTCITEKRPVYLEVRHGAWSLPCEPPEDPENPLEPLPLSPSREEAVAKATVVAVNAVIEKMKAAKHPVLWGGAVLDRWGLQDEFEKLVNLLGIPYTTTHLGKAVISEDTENFIGVYDSAFAPPEVKQVVEGTDCLVGLGTILGNFYGDIVVNTFEQMILAAGGGVRIGHALYPDVPLNRFLPELVKQLEADRAGMQHTPPAGFLQRREVLANRWKLSKTNQESAADLWSSAGFAAPVPDAATTWDSFFAELTQLQTEDMVIMADTSLCLFPSAELPIKTRGNFLAQSVWLSIGYMVGATVGVAVAEPQKRAVALTGDGGFQMICSAFSTLVNLKLEKPPLMIVFDNALYAVEQFLVVSEFGDRNAYYNGDADPIFFNQLNRWDYVKLAEAYGGQGFQINTVKELREAFRQATAPGNAKPSLLAVRIDPRDLPHEVAAVVNSASNAADFDASKTNTGHISLPALN